MAKITEELVRKCAEHNECEIFSLEELSLHQRNISKLEHLDKWCRDLKILYLHNNLISKIENLSRLKKLEYVNFTLNNITKIENLEGCESLKKLDFTANFIGELTSIESMGENYNLEEMHLTGNPCVDFEGYREFVVATLPQLKRLDGEDIKVSERLIAMQGYHQTRRFILEQQISYMRKIDKNYEIIDDFEDDMYESSNDSVPESSFWKMPASNTPRTRLEIYKHMERTRLKDKPQPEKKVKRPRVFFTEDGRPLNINEPKLRFQLTEDDVRNAYMLDLAVYRYLSTALLDADVQPHFVRVLVNAKVFQLHLPQEVRPDASTSMRSQTTGHLLITMPKVSDILKANSPAEKDSRHCKADGIDGGSKNASLSQDCGKSFNKIAAKPSIFSSLVSESPLNKSDERYSELYDNPDVPPLV